METKPLTLRSWLTLFTSFVVLTVAFAFGLFCWPAIYRPLTRAYGWTFAQANAGGSIVLFLIGILSPFVGTLVDKFKPKRVILGGTFIIAVALALLSTIHSRPDGSPLWGPQRQYYAFCFLLGIGASAVSILPTSILIGPFFSRWRGLAVGFINAGIGLGGFIAPRLATAQIAQRGLSGTFLVLAACMAIPFLLTLIVVDNSAVPRRQTTSARVPTMPELARMPMFWIFGIALFFSAHAMLGVQQNLISYLTGAHVSPKEAALILSIALAAAAPGKLISGVLADRVNARAGMIFSVICVALGVLALLNTAPQSDMIYWLAIVFGLGYGGIFNAAPTIIFEYFGTHQVGKALGLFYVFFGLGTASGGELAGYLFDETRRWSVPFTVDLGLACVGLLLLLVSARQTNAAAVHASPRAIRNMKTNLIFEGNCWKFGHNIPTDLITPTHIMFKTAGEMAKHVLETANPDFPVHVKPGDILVAGRNFGCSSGRALAAKALKATGIGAIVAELFSRTFYRNGHEIGLPILEVSGVHDLVETGDRVRVDIEQGTVENLTSGKSLQGNPPSEFLLEMVQSGGLIPLLKSGSKFFSSVAPEMILLNNDEVEQALTPQDAITSTETIYRELAEGKAINRPRSQTYFPLESKEHPGFKYRFKSQEGSGVSSGVWALRITSDMAGFSYTAGVKRRRILPVATGNRYCGLVILFDLERIEPIAIMPDGVIQKVRVAALSVVGAKYLAPENPKVLGLFGSGWQASAHLEFMCSQFAFDKVKVYSPNQEHCREFCRKTTAQLGREIEAVDTPRKVVEGSDVVQAATAAWDAVFDGHWVEKGMYVASIGGSDGSNKRREIDDETIRRADLYVVHSKEVARLDQSPDVWEVAQNGIKSWESIQEVQYLVAGNIKGRTSADQITVFNNNTGAGTQFAAVGAAVLKRARSMGLGREVPTEWFLEDVSP